MFACYLLLTVFNLKKDKAVVKMHNELRDTPKTGDDTNMKLWYVLAGLSAVGIAVTSVVAHKKKKKESNE